MGWNTLDELRAFLGLIPAVLAAMAAQLGNFGDRISSIAVIPEGVYRQAANRAAVITQAYVAPQAAGPGGNPPAVLEVPQVTRDLTPVEVGQIGLMWRIASRIMWTRSGSAWADYPDFDVMVEPANRTAAFAIGVVHAPPPLGGGGVGGPTAGKQMHKMSNTVDQGDDSEFPPPTKTETDTWSQNYYTQEQGHPPEEEEPNEIQVKGFDTRVRAGRTPYVDFGIWGPYGRRLMRALKHRVWYPNGDGTFTHREVTGPENFASYVAIWRVFVVAAKMTRHVMNWALNKYHRNLEQLVRLWPHCWYLIYAADDYMRSEQMERIRRRISASVADGKPPPRDWDENAPWTAVFSEAADDTKFWDQHVTVRAASWMAHGARGAPTAPDEEFAQLNLPGGIQTVRPLTATPKRGAGAGGGAAAAPKSSSKKRRNRNRNNQQGGGAAAPGSGAAPKGGGKAPSGWPPKKGGNKGGGKGVDPESSCFGFSKGFGPCMGSEPGSKCASGRTHKCHLCGGAHIAIKCTGKKTKKEGE